MTVRTKMFGIWAIIGIAMVAVGIYAYRTLTAEPLGDATPAAVDASSDDPYKASSDSITISDYAVSTAGIKTQKVVAEDVPITLTLTGKSALDMEAATHVQPQFGGKIINVAPKLGDMVKGPDAPGGPTVLCVIESNDLAQAKANYLQAQIQLKIDNDELVRSRELFKASVLAEKFVIDAESAVVKDQAALEAARQQLLIFGLKQAEIDDIEHQIGKQRMDYVITSPRSGVVAEKDVSGGEIAAPGNNLFVIADTKTLWVVGDVYERDFPLIKVGQKMKVYFTAEPNRPRDCTINWISPVLDPNTHAVHIQGVLDNSDGSILSDMYCTIVVTIGSGKDSVIVPADAVVRVGTDAFVFVETGRGSDGATCLLTPVKTESIGVGFGAASTASAAISAAAPNMEDAGDPSGSLRITGGLKPGDSIITSGALGLYNEMKLQENGQ